MFSIENYTWARGNMKFLFSCSTRCRVEHAKRNFISPSNHLLLSLLDKRKKSLKAKYVKVHYQTNNLQINPLTHELNSNLNRPRFLRLDQCFFSVISFPKSFY